jgi:hypothetical protein
MTAEETFNQLQTFLGKLSDRPAGERGCDLLLARDPTDEDDDRYEVGRVKVEGSIARELEQLVIEKVDNKLSALNNSENDTTLKEYSVTNTSSDEDLIQHLETSELPFFDRCERILSGQRFEQTTYLGGRQPNFQAIRLHPGNTDEMVIGFQDYTRAQILGRTSRVRMLVNNTTHKRIEQSVMSIPNRLDAVFYKGTIFVFDQRRFEKIFDYHDEFEKVAEQAFTTLEESDIPFSQFDIFREAVVGNKRALRLFYEVEQRGKYRDMDASHVKMVNDRFDTDIHFTEADDGTIQIGMRNKLDVWRILRFLNDDHLTSPITETDYVSTAKEDASRD